MSLIASIVTYVILLLLGSLILKLIAGAMIKGKRAKSYGNALVVMVIWAVIAFFLEFLGVIAFLPGGLLLLVLIYWILFSLLLTGIYKCSFGKALLVALIFVIVLILLLILVGFVVALIIIF